MSDTKEAAEKRLSALIEKCADNEYAPIYAWAQREFVAAGTALFHLRRERDALEKENARLRVALEPFAKASETEWPGYPSDNKRLWAFDLNLTFGDLRRAGAALKALAND